MAYILIQQRSICMPPFPRSPFFQENNHKCYYMHLWVAHALLYSHQLRFLGLLSSVWNMSSDPPIQQRMTAAHTHTHTPKEKLGTRNWLIFSLKRVPESSLSPGLQALTFIICLIFKDLCWFRNSYKQYLKIMIQSQESYIVLHLFLSAL